jgi:uncharacterized protein (TIGR02757 family)
MGESPARFLRRATRNEIAERFTGFVHRFTRDVEMVPFLYAIKCALEKHGTLKRLFMEALDPRDETILTALTGFVRKLRTFAEGDFPSLLPSPEDGSACKRLNLFLRWMARRDEVDPGPWKEVPASKLVVPLDTHLYRISISLGLTRRRQADLATVLEVTRGFRDIRPRDPVRYDFALTRLGIRKGRAEKPFGVAALESRLLKAAVYSP